MYWNQVNILKPHGAIDIHLYENKLHLCRCENTKTHISFYHASYAFEDNRKAHIERYENPNKLFLNAGNFFFS